MTLLPFEGDSARPLRWRVAQVLKRSGHTVLAFSPPPHPESRAALQAYAQRRDVDVFVSGEATEGERGWRLALTVRDASGKQLGSPLEFRGSTLSSLVRDLKDEGQERLARAMHGQSAAPPTVLPLPRRARSAPAPAPSNDDAADAPAASPSAPAAKGAQSWDADADTDTPPPKSKRPSKSAPKEQDDSTPPSKPSRPDRASTAALRLAMANSTASATPSPDSSSARRSASGSAASRNRAADTDSDPAPPPARKATRSAVEADPAKELDPVPGQVTLDADADPGDDADAHTAAEDDSASSKAKPAKGRLSSLFGARGEHSGSADGSGEATPVDEGDSDARAAKSSVPTVILGVQAGVVRRQLTYQDDIYHRLRAPTTNDWVYHLDGEFFPFAPPLKEHLSIIASFESTLSGKVHDARVDRNFDVTFSELAAGMHFRQALGPHEIGVEATLARLSTGLDDPGHLSQVPEFSYTLLTPTLDAKLHFGAVSLRGALGYRRALGSYGEASSAEWFPHMTGYGIDGQLGFEYRISEQVAFEAAGLLRRFNLQMNSKPADAIGGVAEVAKGAVDSYLGGYFGLSLRL